MRYDKNNWHYKIFGFWQEYGNSYLEYPSLFDFIDEETNAQYSKGNLLTYLKSGYEVYSTTRIKLPIIDNINNESTSSTTLRTDGVFFWLDEICYLIQYHNLVIPEDFYAHILANNFTIPELTSAPFDLLSKISYP
ncbi:MAG: hypothetical protein JNJ85_04075 [Candidatus Kapabacteria bacterium]|nr:hypothetical protein [Candidatus Kapabacteria bacterium]